MTKISTPYTSTSYEYDKLDRIVHVVNRNGNATVYEYDANGNRSAVRKCLSRRPAYLQRFSVLSFIVAHFLTNAKSVQAIFFNLHTLFYKLNFTSSQERFYALVFNYHWKFLGMPLLSRYACLAFSFFFLILPFYMLDYVLEYLVLLTA